LRWWSRTAAAIVSGVTTDVIPEPAPRRGLDLVPRSGVVRVLSGRQRLQHAAITAVWIVLNIRFWSYWFADGHAGAAWLYVPTTLGLAYLTTVVPSWFWFHLTRMRRPVHRPAPPNLRVAMITLCVPSHESIDVIKRQLDALPAVRYPHDSWVLDEGGDAEVKRLASERGVRYFTRKGVARWNQPGPPFQARTKAGNVNAWLDHVKAIGEDYEFFVQLDIDHLPRPGYLDRTLGHMAHPRVAWVQAPSVFSNLDCWTARGLAEQDMIFHGPLQLGFYGLSRTPLIVGSHTTYRTSAVREIGGFQPTRAEDHLDTVVLASKGYKGVLVPEVIAEGEGPEDFPTYLHQQFAWAYSMTQILINHFPHFVRRYSPRQAFELFVTESWYVLWAASFAALWALPILALSTDSPIARLSLTEFLGYHVPIMLWLVLFWWWARSWLQPPGILFTWRGMLLELARWPTVLWAVVSAALRITRPYMITPKGGTHRTLPPARRLYAPYIGMALVALASVAGWHLFIGSGEAQGYLLFVLLNVAMLLLAMYVIVGLEVRALTAQLASLRAALRPRVPFLAFLLLLSATTVLATVISWAPVVEVIR
jgi:cellulose synthase (UDP-forming)